MSDDRNVRRILFVEDSEEDFILVKKAFKNSGIANSLFRVKTGDEALDYLNNRAGYEDKTVNKPPEIIILDLNLPGTDGKEVLHQIKSDDRLKKIPVIILTTSDDERDIHACYELGANSYMQKPINFEGFMQAITRLKDYWFEIAILPRQD